MGRIGIWKGELSESLGADYLFFKSGYEQRSYPDLQNI